MKEEKEYKKWIEEMYNKYAPILFIEKYNLNSRIAESDEDYYLASKFNYPYLDATIIYSKKAIEDWKKDKKNSERKIVHEFCHIITDPFYATVCNWPAKDQLEQARERMNDHIAQIVNKHFNLIEL